MRNCVNHLIKNIYGSRIEMVPVAVDPPANPLIYESEFEFEDIYML